MSEARFGNYRTSEVLGTGAFSTIYKAVQEPLGRVVAIKTLKSQISETSSFSDQLEREAAILTDFAHPNVVLLFELARAEGRPYLVLEYVGGPTLQQLLAKRRKLDVETALAIGCGLAAGLAHVHEQGVVHRDVAPSNVLCSKAGVVKLVDFGIAQRVRTVSVSDAFGAEGITPSGRMVPDAKRETFGTPAYMSPEQILGDFVDGRSDLFSLGVLLYQMLSGTRPFEANTVTPRTGTKRVSEPPMARTSRPPPAFEARDVGQRLRRDAPPPLRERAKDVPRAVERIVMRLLEKAPDDRYPDANTVHERLRTELRSMTRQEPPMLVRAALIDAGFARGPKAAHEAGQHRRPLSWGRTLAGFGAAGAVFVGGALMIELTSPSASAVGSQAGTERLPLAPEQAGGLRVLAVPWATVTVDGQQVETTPFARPIPLAEGKHFVTLAHPDAQAVQREVDIVRDQTVTLEVTMALSGGPSASDEDATRKGGAPSTPGAQ